MNKLVVLTLSAALALGGSIAIATVPTGTLLAGASVDSGVRGERLQARMQARMAALGDPTRVAMAQMRWIERIYLKQNQPDAAQAMYRDVLKRTNDPTLRNFANARLARVAAWQPRDLGAALAELKRGLDESLAQVR